MCPAGNLSATYWDDLRLLAFSGDLDRSFHLRHITVNLDRPFEKQLRTYVNLCLQCIFCIQFSYYGKRQNHKMRGSQINNSGFLLVISFRDAQIKIEADESD